METVDQGTSSTVWSRIGALTASSGGITEIVSETTPPVGRVFKCLDTGTGNSLFSNIIYSENVVVSGKANGVPIPVTETLTSANLRFASQLIVGNWYKVETLDNEEEEETDWFTIGALIGNESAPPVGRVFKCLNTGTGTGIATFSNLIYSENVKGEVSITNTSTTPVYVTNVTEGTVIVSGKANAVPVPVSLSTDASVKVTNVTGESVAVTEILASANLRLASQLIVGNWYKVEIVGNILNDFLSEKANWITIGALNFWEFPTVPPVGRVFKCLAIVTYAGYSRYSNIIYSENVVVSGSPWGVPVPVSGINGVPVPVSGTVTVTGINGVPVPVTEILASANLRLASQLIVGNWYKVETVDDQTATSVWNTIGALIGTELVPPVGRVFKCLATVTFTGTTVTTFGGDSRFSNIIYSENVNVKENVDPYLQISKGLINGSKPVFVSGININIESQGVWGGVGDYVDIVSDWVSDTPLGIGAHTLSITGLNQDYDEVTETINMNGTTKVRTTNRYQIIHKMTVLEAGSAGINVGTISSQRADSTLWAGATLTGVVGPHIVIGSNESQSCIYQVPNGHTLYLCNYKVGSNKVTQLTGQAVHSFLAKPFEGVYNLKESTATNIYSNSAYRPFNPPMKIVQKTTIKLQSKTDYEGMECYGSFNGVLVKNSI